MLDEMYANIGEKIKGWAKWTFLIEAIGAVITGLVLLTTDDDLVFYGLLVLICGPVAAWIGSWLLYAFGELVDKTVANEKHTKDILAIIEDKEKPQIKAAPLVSHSAPSKPRAAVAHSWRCDNCGKMTTQSPCEHCGLGAEKKKAPYLCGKCGHIGPYDGNCPSCGSSIKFFDN